MEGMWYLNGFAEAQPTKSKSIFNSMPALLGTPRVSECYWLLGMFSSWLELTNQSTSYLDLVLFLDNINQLPKAECILRSTDREYVVSPIDSELAKVLNSRSPDCYLFQSFDSLLVFFFLIHLRS